MARIPTLSASSIAPLPGSAGGVKLGWTGVGSVPIETPLTPRLNPSQYGQEGAAIAQLGEKIFLEGVLPGIEISRKNAKAKATLEASNQIYNEVNAIKGELLQNELSPGWEYSTKEGIFDEEVAWGKRFKDLYTRIDKIIPGISLGIKDKKHAIAVTNAFLPQVMALKLRAQNRQKELSGDRAAYSYQQNQKNHMTDLTALLDQVKQTKNKNGELVYVFPGTKIDELMQRMELTDTVFANSGLAPLKRFDTIEKARKAKLKELVNRLQIEPEMAKEFLERYGEQLGMTPGELGDMTDKMEEFAVQRIRMDNFLDEQADNRMEQAAQAELNAQTQLEDGTIVSYRTSLLIRAHRGDLTSVALFNRRDLFDRAGDITTYNDIMTQVEKYDLAAGETDPKVYDDYLNEIAMLLGRTDVTSDELAALETKISNDTKRISKGDLIKLLGGINLKNHNSLKDPDYMRGEALLKKQAPVPDEYDNTAPAHKSRAIWRIWYDDINRLIKKNDAAAWRNFDFFARATEIIDTHSDLWGDVSGTGSQSHFKEKVNQFNAALGTDLDFMVRMNPGDTLGYPDVDAMRAALHHRTETHDYGESDFSINKEQARKFNAEIKRANELIDSLGKFSGLPSKVAVIRAAHQTLADQAEAARLAAEKAEQDSQQTHRDWTPNPVEEWLKKTYPEFYKKRFGTDGDITLTTPAPETEEPPPPPQPSNIELPDASGTNLTPEPEPVTETEEPPPPPFPKSTGEQVGIAQGAYGGRPVIANVDGTFSHVRLFTFQVDTPEGPKWVYFPSIFNGVAIEDRAEADVMAQKMYQKYKGVDPETDVKSPFFDTEPEASAAAAKISEDTTWAEPEPVTEPDESVLFNEYVALAQTDFASELLAQGQSQEQVLSALKEKFPQLKEHFDPRGSGYDKAMALAAGMQPELDSETGEMHWRTRLPITRAETKKALGFNPNDDVGLVLKGEQHISWDKAKKGDEALGYKYIKKGYRWYSVKPGTVEPVGKTMPPPKPKPKPKPKKVSKKPISTNIPILTFKELQAMRINGDYVHSDVEIQDTILMLSSEAANLSQSQEAFLERLREVLSLRKYIRDQEQNQSPKD